MGKKEKEVEEALNRLEQGIEKIAEVFDQYTETVRQEIAFINQRIMDLESKIDTTTSWSSFSAEGKEALKQRTAPPVSKAPLPEPTKPPEREYTPAKSYTPPPRETEVTASHSPPSQIRQPARQEATPPRFVTKEDIGIGGASQEEGFGGYRPARGGIVEEKYVKPSVFSREMNKLEAAAAASPQYGPGGYPLPPSMQLRSQISTVLGKIKPEAQRRVPRPEPVPGYGGAPGYGAA
ncbi:MAG: hypothetical protein QW279_14655, partial [Candidatus Jordarchaeaceae archaeon]